MGPTERVARARSAVADVGAAPGTRVFVACSGGADSLALAATLAYVAPREGWVAGAIVVDHGLREGSAAEADDVARLCRSLGLDARVHRVTVAADGTGSGAGGPEAAARDARYAALEDAAGEDGIVLLGHTLDDQAETVLLGLARGSGARSLAGMAPAIGRYRRPFLWLRRTDTVGICADLGLAPLDDPTNAIDGPWRRADGGPLRRSALRHAVIPALEEALGPGVVPALGRTAAMLRADADLLDELAAAALDDATVGTASPEEVILRVNSLVKLPEAVRTRAVHRAIMDRTTPGTRGAVGSRHVDAVDRLLTDYRGQGSAHLPGFVVASRGGEQLTIARRPRVTDERE
ncbi:MAG TPA: tRNA lysidine(34) synthetase TilS [Actinomycetaceae bacterium]|nr:tRNA lysidine(34) synthetase TilS [Actinomycetaceae bacterium]